MQIEKIKQPDYDPRIQIGPENAIQDGDQPNREYG